MTEENEEQTLQETLEAAFEEHTKEPATVQIEAETKPDDAAVAEKTSSGRDEKGRFKEVGTAKDAAVIAPINTAKKPPEFWPQARKEKFATLPADVQEIMLEREAEVEKGFTKLDEDRNFGKSLKEVITPYMAVIQAEGGTPAAAVKDLLNTAYVLRTGSPQQKAAVVHQVIKQFGIDPRLIGAQQIQNPQQNTQPMINKEDIVKDVMTTLHTQQMNDSIASELKAFSADPNNVHFLNPAVKGKMSSLLGTGEAKNYQDAYDQAIWLVPELRPALIAAQTPQQPQRNQDIAAKKKAGSSVSGSPGITVPNSGNPNRSLREELEANLSAFAH